MTTEHIYMPGITQIHMHTVKYRLIIEYRRISRVIFQRYPMINQFIVYWSCANGIETEWLM